MSLSPKLSRLLVLVWASTALGRAAAAPPASLDDFAAQNAKDVKPQDVIHWEAAPATEAPDGHVTVALRMTATQGWRIYGENLKFASPSGFFADVAPPPAHRVMDQMLNKEVDIYDGGEFNLTFTGAPGAARWQGATFPVAITYVGCTGIICLLPYTQTLDVTYVPATAATDAAAQAAAPAPVAGAGVQAAAPAPAATTVATVGANKAADTAPASGEDDDLQTRLARQFNAGGMSVGMLLAIVFFGGLLSNLTPCVAPMVPITLRLLARQGSSPYVSASAYALGIVVTYSLLGLVAALSGGLFGSLLASKAFNVIFAAIMILLGATMLGFGDLSKIQMLGNRLGSGKPSFRNTFLMGTGAGLVAAPCTGPILAALLAYAAKNNAGVAQSTLLLGTYSVGFALPYVALGGAAAKVTAVKVSPRVQVGVKLLFAAVMFGLGLYYLRIPLYGVVEAMRAHWHTIAPLALVLGAALTAVWTVVPSLQTNKASMLLPTVVLGLGIFAGSQWATSTSEAEGGATVMVYHSVADAVAAAKQSGRPILVDTWAEWCEACKKMDVTTFADPRVRELLASGWIYTKLDFTETTPATDQLQATYGVQSLPTLILLPPDGRLDAKQSITGYVTAATLLNTLKQFTHQKAE